MKCDICEKEKKTIPFYWGFFKTEYEPDKWVNACSECCRNFLRASTGYNFNKEPLINMEQQIKHKTRKRR